MGDNIFGITYSVQIRILNKSFQSETLVLQKRNNFIHRLCKVPVPTPFCVSSCHSMKCSLKPHLRN